MIANDNTPIPYCIIKFKVFLDKQLSLRASIDLKQKAWLVRSVCNQKTALILYDEEVMNLETCSMP